MHRIEKVRFREKILRLPSSKSETHRALILAALNRGTSTITGPLWSEDTLVTKDALVKMGANFQQMDDEIHNNGSFGKVHDPSINLINSGSSARFLLPIGCLCDKALTFSGTDRLHQRPMGTLIKVLRDMGARLEDHNGFLPVTTFPSHLKGGVVRFGEIPSSQYVTALLLAANRMERDLEIIFEKDIPSMPYVELTIRMLQRLGIQVETGEQVIQVPARGLNIDFSMRIGQDMSSASYWVALAMIHRARIEFDGLCLPSLQGDEAIFEIAAEAGSNVMVYEDRVVVEGDIKKALDVDCKGIPDLVPALAVIAMFAPDISYLRNVEHLRYKESDRIQALQQNIAVLGGKSEYEDGTLKILPQKPYTGGKIHSFNDHRIAMSFAVAGTRIGDVIIDQPECVEKSYPSFWNDFEFFQPLMKEI